VKLRRELIASTSAAAQALRKERDELKATHQQELDAAAKKAAEALGAAQARHAQEMQCQQDATAKAAASAQRLQSEIERLTRDGQRSMQAIIQEKKKLESDLAGASSAAVSLKTEVSGLKQQLSQLQTSVQTELDAAKEKTDRMKREHESVVASMKAASDALLNHAEADRQQLEKARDVCQESDAAAKKAAEALGAAQARHAQEMQDATAKAAASEQRLQSDIERLTGDGQRSMQAEQRAVAAERDRENAIATSLQLQQDLADLRREAADAAEESAQALVVVSDALRLEAAGKTAAEQRAVAAERDRENAIATSLQLQQDLADLRREAADAAAKVLADASNGITGFYPVPAAPVQGGMSDDEYMNVCHRRYFYHLLREVSAPPHCLQHPMTPSNSLQLHVLGVPRPRSHAQGNIVRLQYCELSTPMCPCPEGWSATRPSGEPTPEYNVDGPAG
jgi:uncharacterized protein YbaA (DUF1428 family)